MKKKLIFPNSQSLTAIGTNINIFPAGHQFLTELFIIVIIPSFLETLCFQITQLMGGIFVKTAGYNQSIPGNNISVPELPAVIA